MEEVMLEKSDELVMKLLHFFITEQGYSPIVLHGAKNEIWLENLGNSYPVVRIVSNYIHNDEQLSFDLYRTGQILKKVRKKTCSIHMEALSLFVNLGDSVHLENYMHFGNISCADIKTTSDLKKYPFILDEFPTITKNTSFRENGVELFMKITKDISRKNEEEAKKNEKVFEHKKPIMTYLLIAITIFIFLLMYLIGKGSNDVNTLLDFGANYGPYVKGGDYYRLLTSAFLHIGLLHLIMNMYTLYIVGSQLESFLGKGKYVTIYLGSAILGNLLSMLFTNGVSAGASGAIFGLFGSLLYFGYHYRVYLGSVLKSQIIPLIALNLIIGFSLSGIDNAAHIGGLIGGYFITMALGIPFKSTNGDRMNGWILTIIYTIFLVYMAFHGIVLK